MKEEYKECNNKKLKKKMMRMTINIFLKSSSNVNNFNYLIFFSSYRIKKKCGNRLIIITSDGHCRIKIVIVNRLSVPRSTEPCSSSNYLIVEDYSNDSTI